MASTKEQQISTLFVELKKSSDEYDDERSLQLVNELLKYDSNNQLALHCKVVTLIRLDRYTDALSMIARQLKNTSLDLNYEKIYCYYRTNQLSQALELLDSAKKQNPEDPSLLYLEAQLLYSQGKFEESVRVNEKLLASTQDREASEIKVNLLAAQAGLLFSHPETDKKVEVGNGSDLYEVAYNAASVYLARGQVKKAQEQLEMAKKQCNDKSAGMSQEEHKEELAVISTQLAYTYQLQGRTEEAVKIYKSLVNSSDVTVAAVSSNNIVSIEQTKDLDDVAQKLKAATNKEADAKLKNYQKRVILMNDALLQLYSSKYSACRDQTQKLISKYPDNESLYLILASATYHQHKAAKAIEELQSVAKKNPTSLAIHFATIQLQVLESQPAAALTTLTNYLGSIKDDGLAYKPAVVALLVWLYEQTGQSEKAIETLDKASEVWKGSKDFKNTSAPTSTIKQTAAFKLKSGRFNEAVTDYEQLVKADPTDAQAIAGLIAAYAEVDPAKAEQYGSALPEVALNHFDLDTLEKVVPGVKRGYVKKDPNAIHAKKPRNKKKRAPLMPKSYDANVKPDPERWIPKQERSTYRVKGKNKKAANKGPQGAAVEGGGIGGTGSANIGGKKPAAPAAPVEKTPETPAKPATQSSSSKSKKKKGKGKNKW